MVWCDVMWYTHTYSHICIYIYINIYMYDISPIFFTTRKKNIYIYSSRVWLNDAPCASLCVHACNMFALVPPMQQNISPVTACVIVRRPISGFLSGISYQSFPSSRLWSSCLVRLIAEMASSARCKRPVDEGSMPKMNTRLQFGRAWA